MEILADSAAKVFGRDFFGLEAVNQTFTTRVETETPIQLSPEEILLDQARSRGEFPIYRIDKTSDGSPLTMHRMAQALERWFDEKDHGKILYDTAWYQDEAFFMEDTPRPGLALISKALVPGSTNSNYWEQTEILRMWAEETYKGRELPEGYQDALKEWAKEKAGLKRILTSD